MTPNTQSRELAEKIVKQINRNFGPGSYSKEEIIATELQSLLERVEKVEFPDIGQDPLKMEKRDGFAESFERLRSGLCVQQRGVPDQTALVWRIDLSRVSDELIVQRARGESFMSAMAQVDKLKAERDQLAKDKARLVEACRSLQDKMRSVYVSAEYQSVWVIHQSHCGQYTGQSWETEFNTLAALLKEME